MPPNDIAREGCSVCWAPPRFDFHIFLGLSLKRQQHINPEHPLQFTSWLRHCHADDYVLFAAELHILQTVPTTTSVQYQNKHRINLVYRTENK